MLLFLQMLKYFKAGSTNHAIGYSNGIQDPEKGNTPTCFDEAEVKISDTSVNLSRSLSLSVFITDWLTNLLNVVGFIDLLWKHKFTDLVEYFTE